MFPVPKDREVYETPIATAWIDDEGFLVSNSKPPKRTIENTTINFELVRKLGQGQKMCLLTFLCNSPIPDKETRNFVTQNLPSVYKAMAMVSKGGLGNIIMNILFKLNAPVIPMRNFTNEEDARQWLRKF